MAQQPAVLFQPSDPIRGVYDAVVQYYLASPMDSVTIEILDAEGKIVDTFTGTEPVYKPDPNLPWWLRGGSSVPTTAAGMNTFTWDLRYPGATSFDGMIIWSARPTRGPKAPLGEYQVRLRAGDHTQTYPFTIQMDPNLKGITPADLQEQFELAMQIRDKTSEANEAVIRIREVRKHLQERLAQTSDSGIEQAGQQLLDQISGIEEELYQVRNQSGQDPLNFPIRLNNRLASLRRSVETGDARPTAGAYKVFAELSAELEDHLQRLDRVLSEDLEEVNAMLKQKGIDAVNE